MYKRQVEGGDIVEPLHERVLGRVLAIPALLPGSDEVAFEAGTMLDEENVARLEQLAIDYVLVRSPITCEVRYGVCQQCYGRDLARGHKISMGEAVGVMAAQSIGEPGTQLTMRTFHIGGAATSSAATSSIEIKSAGTLKLEIDKTVTNKKGQIVAVTRSGEIKVLNEQGRERERYKVPYGATIMVKDSTKVKQGQIVASWDPHTHPCLLYTSPSPRD